MVGKRLVGKSEMKERDGVGYMSWCEEDVNGHASLVRSLRDRLSYFATQALHVKLFSDGFLLTSIQNTSHVEL